MLSDFKAFIAKGNVIDLAVAVIIGGAFGKIVSSLVNDVIMPPIGMAMGGVDFSDLAIALGEGEEAASINYGMFINNVLDFLIVAFAIAGLFLHSSWMIIRDARSDLVEAE